MKMLLGREYDKAEFAFSEGLGNKERGIKPTFKGNDVPPPVVMGLVWRGITWFYVSSW